MNQLEDIKKIKAEFKRKFIGKGYQRRFFNCDSGCETDTDEVWKFFEQKLVEVKEEAEKKAGTEKFTISEPMKKWVEVYRDHRIRLFSLNNKTNE